MTCSTVVCSFGSKLWSSPFNISKSAHATESSSIHSRSITSAKRLGNGCYLRSMYFTLTVCERCNTFAARKFLVFASILSVRPSSLFSQSRAGIGACVNIRTTQSKLMTELSL
uniref:Uncharacterized protein n=1 Tax=Hyaloperonospora arabidopsidis (strain Emoy2) TaxID=559515 RepID=M4BH63_HYAAE